MITDIPDSTRILIADMILAWGRFDALVSQLVIVTHGMPMDIGAMFIGNMPTKAKLDKLVALSDHVKIPNNVGLKQIRSEHQKHGDVRNLICHSLCAGYLVEQPDRLLFAPVKAKKGEFGHMTVDLIHLDQIRSADYFARECGDLLQRIIEKILKQQEEQHEAFRQGRQPSPSPQR